MATDYTTLFNQLNGLQQTANLGRIPDAANLEAQSSKDIADLLNPPTMFQDTSRIAAELGAGRGITSSAAAYGTGLRMTDEERLKRIALGQNMLTSALGRNPTADPAQAVSLSNQAESIANQKQAQDDELSYRYWLANRSGGAGGGGGYGGSMAPGFEQTQKVDASIYDYPVATASYGTKPEELPTWTSGLGTSEAPVTASGLISGVQDFDDYYEQLFGAGTGYNNNVTVTPDYSVNDYSGGTTEDDFYAQYGYF